MAWVKKDEEVRRELMPDLLVNVRLPLITPQYLSDTVAQEELVKTSLRCRSVYPFMCQRKGTNKTIIIQ